MNTTSQNSSGSLAPQELVDADLEKMTRDELITLVLRWRKMAPVIKDMCGELADYREIAPTAAQLQIAIEGTVNTYIQTIKQQSLQIKEMEKFIEEMMTDPLGVERRLNERTGRASKKLLN